jgi:hypothetical protein
MSAEGWLRAAKTEEERLLSEIMKTDLYRQLEAVRGVLAVYLGAATIVTPSQAATSMPIRPNGAASEHTFKMANAFSEMNDSGGDRARTAAAG